MESSFHGHDGNACQIAADKLSGVRLDRRFRKVRNLRVVNDSFLLDLLCKPAKPRPKNQPDPRCSNPLISNGGNSGVDSFSESMHGVSFTKWRVGNARCCGYPGSGS